MRIMMVKLEQWLIVFIVAGMVVSLVLATQ